MTENELEEIRDILKQWWKNELSLRKIFPDEKTFENSVINKYITFYI